MHQFQLNRFRFNWARSSVQGGTCTHALAQADNAEANICFTKPSLFEAKPGLRRSVSMGAYLIRTKTWLTRPSGTSRVTLLAERTT